MVELLYFQLLLSVNTFFVNVNDMYFKLERFFFAHESSALKPFSLEYSTFLLLFCFLRSSVLSDASK